ncbi:MAG: hypothetical protein QOE61_4538 [Micromonosporaceae bacterium]|jgi:hypothetical protein|nr:hypothetical protein [Micromonosporaceae bacterium]
MTAPQRTTEADAARDDSRAPTGPADETIGCRFDAAAIRQWLTSARPDTFVTVAQELNVIDDFDLSGFHKWPRINNLLAAAQHEEVFGVLGHTIGVLHVAGDSGFVEQHRVTLDTPQRGVLCSDGFDTAELLTDYLSGIDAAVHLLARTAQATDTLLHHRALLAQVDWPTPTVALAPAAQRTARPVPQHSASRAFRPLALAEQAPASAPLPDSATAAPRRRR